MTILAIHRTAPNWPDDPNRPVYQRNGLWVETDGPAPTQAQIDAFLNPPPSPEQTRETTFLNDTDRSGIIPQLLTGSPSDIETYVRGKINADGVTDLASAKTCLKRCETAIVMLAKALVLNVNE